VEDDVDEVVAVTACLEAGANADALKTLTRMIAKEIIDFMV